MFFTLWGVAALVQAYPRWRRSVPADGVVVEVGSHTLASPGSAWRLTVAYRDAERREQRAVWVGASNVDLTRYRPGLAVPVRYDPQEPRWIWLPGGGRPHPLVLPVAFTLIGPVVVAGWLLLR